MDWARYKALCDRPDYWSRWMLLECLELFDAAGERELAAALRAALAAEPLAQPADHSGPPMTRMFRLTFDPAQRRRAVAVVTEAVAADRRTSGTRTRGLAGFAAAWQEYARFAADAESPDR